MSNTITIHSNVRRYYSRLMCAGADTYAVNSNTISGFTSTRYSVKILIIMFHTPCSVPSAAGSGSGSFFSGSGYIRIYPDSCGKIKKRG